MRVPWPRMAPWLVAVAIPLVAAAFLGRETPAAAGDQCVACHTDPAKLKALAVEPPISAEEGEG